MDKNKFDSAFIFREIGEHDFYISIFLKNNSGLLEKYPPTIHGNIFYSEEERNEYKKCSNDEINNKSKNKVKIITYMQNISSNVKNDLKYDGIDCSEIENILFLPLNYNTQENTEGIKAIPGIIYIPYEPILKDEYEGFFLNLYYNILRDGYPLLNEEKFEFIGITIALNDNIDKNILDKLKISQNEVVNNPKIWYYYYKTKDKLSHLSEMEQVQYLRLKNIFISEKLNVLIEELNSSTSKWNDLLNFDNQMKIILQEIINFKDVRFGFYDPCIFIDLKSYLHIILRHIKDTQIGENFLKKSTIPYKLKDLKALIDKIIDSIDEEIKSHFSLGIQKKFSRHGKMSIYFNRDYYTVDIELDGRISTFYKNN